MSLPLQYFHKLVESCLDIVIAVDRQGTITFYNDGARQNLGFMPEEVLGKNVLAIYPSREVAKKVMAAMRCGAGEGRGRVSNFETTFKTRKGELIPVAISASIIYDDQEREIGSIGFAKDIREIRRKDRLATLCEIAVGLSHEINNSLEVLVNQMDLLQKYVGRVATDEDYIVESERLESVADQVKKIQQITRRIGEMTEEGEYGTREYFDGKMMTDLQVNGVEEQAGRSRKDLRYPLRGLRVLVVDDDLGICQSLKDLLEEERCDVETAPSGIQAMEWLARREFDLVLSDVVMPDMDGYQLYHAVKEKFPGLPMILMTAFYYDKDHVIKRSCVDGLQGVIFKKPINPVRLKKLIFRECGARIGGQTLPGSPPPGKESGDALKITKGVTVSKEARYNEGMELFAQDKLDEAVAAYQAALAEDPEYADALHALAMTYAHQDKLDEAIEAGRRLIAAAPDDELAHTSLSIFYQRKGMIAEAEQIAARARTLGWKRQLEEKKAGEK